MGVIVATNKEILEQIDDLRKKMPNGELTLISKSVKDLQTGQQELKEDIRDLKKQLLDPDDGVVVRVNKNSEFRRDRELKLPEFGEAFDHLRDTLHWKDNVNKALWILFTAVVGLVIKTLVMSG
jgi:hypothetical protein|tara:strand:- start:918 stop:1289 length:372 start_codon:yes stop_codon:yes gene_type:complete